MSIGGLRVSMNSFYNAGVRDYERATAPALATRSGRAANTNETHFIAMVW
jgi:hypothetical protein